MQNNYILRERSYMYNEVNLLRHAKFKREDVKERYVSKRYRDPRYARNNNKFFFLKK